MLSNEYRLVHFGYHGLSGRYHRPMPMFKRAAQFAPFAALTGYDDAVREEARLTDDFSEADDDRNDMLSAKLNIVERHIDELPEVQFTYFVPDNLKEGGSYVDVRGNVRRIDVYNRVIILTDSRTVPFGNLTEINGDIFKEYENEIQSIISLHAAYTTGIVMWSF